MHFRFFKDKNKSILKVLFGIIFVISGFGISVAQNAMTFEKFKEIVKNPSSVNIDTSAISQIKDMSDEELRAILQAAIPNHAAGSVKLSKDSDTCNLNKDCAVDNPKNQGLVFCVNDVDSDSANILKPETQTKLGESNITSRTCMLADGGTSGDASVCASGSISGGKCVDTFGDGDDTDAKSLNENAVMMYDKIILEAKAVISKGTVADSAVFVAQCDAKIKELQGVRDAIADKNSQAWKDAELALTNQKEICKFASQQTGSLNGQADADVAAAANSKSGVTTPCKPKDGSGGDGLTTTGGVPTVCGIGYGTLSYILDISGAMAALSANAFDAAVDGYVLNIKTLFRDACTKEDVADNYCTQAEYEQTLAQQAAGVGEGDVFTKDKAWVYNVWATVRDFTNIVVVFSALYVGVRYMMGSEELDFRKNLTKIIMTALLINFSFPISKFLVDISNFLSVSIRGGITQYLPGVKISDIILNYTGLSDVVGAIGNGGNFSTFSQMWLAITFLIVSFFVFLYAAVMIIVRAIILLVTVVFSPVMFLTSSFKSFEGINKLWRENYVGQILYGPILMFGFWLSIGFLVAANAVTLTDEIKMNVDGGRVLLPLIMAIASLFLAVFAAGKAAGGVGGAVGSMMGGLMKNAGLLAVTGGAGLAMRNTVGRAGMAMTNSKWIQDKAKNGGALTKNFAKGIALAGDRAAGAKITLGGKSSKSSLDVKAAADKKFTEDKNKHYEENSSSLKAAGLSDSAKQAKNQEEHDHVKSQLEKAKNDPNHKVTTIEQYRAEKKAREEKQKENDKLTSQNNVSDKNKEVYINTTDELKSAQSQKGVNTNTSKREERIAAVKAGREQQIENTKGSYSLNKDGDIMSQKQKQEIKDKAEKSLNSLGGLESKNNENVKTQNRIKELKESKESLENTTRLAMLRDKIKSRSEKKEVTSNAFNTNSSTSSVSNNAFNTNSDTSNTSNNAFNTNSDTSNNP